MKTPMQELIKELKDLQESLDPYGLHDAIEFAESMLEKEKEAMCQFADEFAIECINFHHDRDWETIRVK